MTFITTICPSCGTIQRVAFVCFDRGTAGNYVCQVCRCLFRIAAKEPKEEEDILTSVLIHHGNPIQNRKELQ